MPSAAVWLWPQWEAPAHSVLLRPQILQPGKASTELFALLSGAWLLPQGGAPAHPVPVQPRAEGPGEADASKGAQEPPKR
jgi:hypothetical protein